MRKAKIVVLLAILFVLAQPLSAQSEVVPTWSFSNIWRAATILWSEVVESAAHYLAGGASEAPPSQPEHTRTYADRNPESIGGATDPMGLNEIGGATDPMG